MFHSTFRPSHVFRFLTASYCYIFEDLNESARFAALKWFFSANINMRLKNGSPRCAFRYRRNTKPEMVCFFMLQKPDEGEVGFIDMLRHGILLLPFKFGFRAFLRCLILKAYHEKLHQEVVNEAHLNDGSSFFHLERMVVHPDLQGQGYGSKYLGEALAQVEDAGFGVILSTQEARNVKFYTRLGFAVVKNDPYFTVAGKDKITNFVMVKAAPSNHQRCIDRSESHKISDIASTKIIFPLRPAFLLSAAYSVVYIIRLNLFQTCS